MVSALLRFCTRLDNPSVGVALSVVVAVRPAPRYDWQIVFGKHFLIDIVGADR